MPTWLPTTRLARCSPARSQPPVERPICSVIVCLPGTAPPRSTCQGRTVRIEGHWRIEPAGSRAHRNLRSGEGAGIDAEPLHRRRQRLDAKMESRSSCRSCSSATNASSSIWTGWSAWFRARQGVPPDGGRTRAQRRAGFASNGTGSATQRCISRRAPGAYRDDGDDPTSGTDLRRNFASAETLLQVESAGRAGSRSSRRTRFFDLELSSLETRRNSRSLRARVAETRRRRMRCG